MPASSTHTTAHEKDKAAKTASRPTVQLGPGTGQTAGPGPQFCPCFCLPLSEPGSPGLPLFTQCHRYAKHITDR